MGQPDEIKQTMDEAFQASLMPGPMIGGGVGGQGEPTGATNAGPQVMYFIYKWRSNHDYLWFKVDAETERVIESSWYHAYE
jgi:hypothetical protein